MTIISSWQKESQPIQGDDGITKDELFYNNYQLVRKMAKKKRPTKMQVLHSDQPVTN